MSLSRSKFVIKGENQASPSSESVRFYLQKPSTADRVELMVEYSGETWYVAEINENGIILNADVVLPKSMMQVRNGEKYINVEYE